MLPPTTIEGTSPTTITATLAATTVTATTRITNTTASQPSAVPTTIPPLTVRIVSSGGALRAGQNHVLSCEASGGGSMAYTYKWLRNGSIVSGQMSSTYSFSPLLVIHSGQYSCQVSVGSMNVTSEGVDIIVVGKSRYDYAITLLTQFQLLCTIFLIINDFHCEGSHDD